MTYSASWTNRRLLSDGVEATLRLVDGAGVYPDVTVNKYFRGHVLADLTNAFLLPHAKFEAAQSIQNSVVNQADNILDGLVAAAWQNVMPAAFATFRAQVVAALAGSNIDAAAVQTRIQNQWTANGVSGVLNSPTVTIALNMPAPPKTGDSVVVVSVQNG